MDSYQVTLAWSETWTRVLVKDGGKELLKAMLPPPAQVRNERAAAQLLEAIALWLDTKLRVVLSVAAGQGACCLGLVPGVRSLFYQVEVIEVAGRRRRAARIRGLAECVERTDPRQMCFDFVGVAADE